MKRIIVVGVSGCGKTTTARKLSEILNIPSHDLDEYYWLPNWQLRTREEFNFVIDTIAEKESWIISGNFSNYQQSFWQRCDTIIWLDYNLLRCLTQALARSIKRIITKNFCCNGNYETIKNLLFSKNSIIYWILSSYNKRRGFYNEIFNNHSNQKKYIRFFTRGETTKWLKEVVARGYINLKVKSRTTLE